MYIPLPLKNYILYGYLNVHVILAGAATEISPEAVVAVGVTVSGVD